MTGKQNPRRREIAAETRAILVARFPKCFMRKADPKLPLKIGIDKDLVAQCPDISAVHIRIAMRDYTGGPRYLKAMVEGARRVALDGSDAGFVTAGSAQFAASMLDEVNARIAAARVRRAEAAEKAGVDKYGNPLSGDRIINCCFPDCGCDGARLCQAENGASWPSVQLNLEKGAA